MDGCGSASASSGDLVAAGPRGVGAACRALLLTGTARPKACLVASWFGIGIGHIRNGARPYGILLQGYEVPGGNIHCKAGDFYAA